jgi:hypothetical protein
MNLIQIVEDRQAELETEIRLCREILVILRGARNKAKTGPIVYGNGYKGGRTDTVTKPKRSKTGTNSLVHQATLQARAEIEKMLRSHPEGLTTKQMAEGVKKAGIQITDSTIHNALRKLNPIKLNNSSARSIPNTIYALPRSK